MKLYIKSDTDTLDVRKIRELRNGIIDIYQATRDDAPSDTVDALIEQYGVDDAKYIVAVLVNAKGRFDGRISGRVFDWAERIAPDENSLMNKGIYYTDAIHPAHMNQIASEIMRR